MSMSAKEYSKIQWCRTPVYYKEVKQKQCRVQCLCYWRAPFVVKIISHSLSSSISSVVSASLLSLLYFSIIPSSVEVNNEYRVVWSPSLTEIRAVVVFVEFLMRNRELQFIHLSIGEFCWNWTFLEQLTQL